jgi:hypothetical protein
MPMVIENGGKRMDGCVIRLIEIIKNLLSDLFN